MTIKELFFLAFAVLCGLALFIFGMNIMTDGLRLASGSKLRRILTCTTRNRLAGITLGTLLGTLVQSSATTVMLVGFVNAGLMSLEQTVPAMLGANIGTTVSMQAVSFKLGDYCFVGIAVGFILSLTAPNQKVRECGRALMGFGLLFLGLNVMSDAIRPHREQLAPILSHVHGDTLGGMLAGVAISAALTGIWQSSGATVAICFALATAGVFTQLHQVYPIVLGAHIGTCATALLGSIGTNIEARRSAVSHLLFNIFNAALGVVASPFFFWLIPLTSNDLVRQIANLHTAIMVVAAGLVLPVSVYHARLVRILIPTRKPLPQPSFLDEKLLEYPEQAIVAVLKELQRVSRICSRSLHLNAHVLLFDYSRKTVQKIKLNENIVDEIKLATRELLSGLTRHYLSRRQSILIQHLNRCMTDIERIGDHIDEICDLTLKRRQIPEAVVDKESLEWLLDLYRSADRVIELVIDSLNPEHEEFQQTAEKILLARDEYVQKSIRTKMAFMEKIVRRVVTPIAAMYFSEYVSALDRIVRHAKSIALAQKQPDFWIKRKKLPQHAKEAPRIELPKLVDPNDYLDQLQEEDYL